MSRFFKRTWAEVDLGKAERNFRRIRACVPDGCMTAAIVKADAYGSGAVAMAKVFDAVGTEMFGVSNLDEAVQLREAGLDKPILILGFTPADCAAELIKYDVTQSAFSLKYARELSREAVAAGGKIKIHFAVDTGMSRIGFVFDGKQDQTSADEIKQASELPGLETDGAFTHFAVADEPDNPFTDTQFARFERATELIAACGVKLRVRHCCNSAALLLRPEMSFEMVRPGIILYGLTPAEGMPMPIELEPVMSLKTVVFQIKTLSAGVAVSYGMKYYTDSPRRIATIPIGYADGFTRSMSNCADVLVCGRRAPVVGRVCMDQCMIDVTDIPDVREGSVVTVVGTDGSQTISMEEYAGKMGTINYEASCLIGKRVPRIYIKDGREIGELDYFRP